MTQGGLITGRIAPGPDPTGSRGSDGKSAAGSQTGPTFTGRR